MTAALSTQGVSNTIVKVNDLKALEAAIRPNTKAIYAETFGNPNSDVTNLEAVAEIAHKHGIVFIVDNTFAPILIRPLEHGADIVVHSASMRITSLQQRFLGLPRTVSRHPLSTMWQNKWWRCLRLC